MNRIIPILPVLFVAACSSTPVVETPEPLIFGRVDILPDDAAIRGSTTEEQESWLDFQLAMLDRNTYVNKHAQVKILDKSSCPMEVSAHRGHYEQAESSAAAIVFATAQGYDDIEIDVMLLGDGTWVNHHDEVTGRATVSTKGKKQLLRLMRISDWKKLRVRDKNSHRILNSDPLTAKQAFKVFAERRSPGQKLNVEIKSNGNEKRLRSMDRMLKSIVGKGNYYYSSGIAEVVTKMRVINPEVYLGYIHKPHPSSMANLRREIESGVSTDKLYIDRKSILDRWMNRGQETYGKFWNEGTTPTQDLKTIKKRVGANTGLHLDIRTYRSDPGILRLADDLGLKVVTYSINGDDYHRTSLKVLKNKNALPHGIIVDSSPYHICHSLFGSANKKGGYSAKHRLGRYVESLPNDADLGLIDEESAYITQGYYTNLDGRVLPVNNVEHSSFKQRSKFLRQEIKDVKITFEEKAPIEITIGNSDKEE